MPAELGALGSPAAAPGSLRGMLHTEPAGLLRLGRQRECCENWGHVRVLMVLPSLLTFGKQFLFFKSFLEAEWKT